MTFVYYLYEISVNSYEFDAFFINLYTYEISINSYGQPGQEGFRKFVFIHEFIIFAEFIY